MNFLQHFGICSFQGRKLWGFQDPTHCFQFCRKFWPLGPTSRNFELHVTLSVSKFFSDCRKFRPLGPSSRNFEFPPLGSYTCCHVRFLQEKPPWNYHYSSRILDLRETFQQFSITITLTMHCALGWEPVTDLGGDFTPERPSHRPKHRQITRDNQTLVEKLIRNLLKHFQISAAS